MSVVRPGDAGACAAALLAASRDRRAVRVQGGGTKSYLGDARPADLTLETAGLSGVIDHVPADLTVTVAAGTRVADLQRALAERGQFLPLDPPHAADGATIGGVIASASDGFGRLRYGGIRDILIGSVVALADGTLASAGGRVVKNVAGYDLNKLIIGSLGTLGVVVEATLKVLPLPEASGLAVARLRSAHAALAVTDALVRTPLRPSALAIEGSRAWAVHVAAQGTPAQVERAMRETRIAADAAGATTERSDDLSLLAPLRELPATATDGALVRAAVPLGALRSFVESASRLDTFARLVADAGTGVVRVHLRGDDAAVLIAADTLIAGAAVVGGSARVERRAAALQGRLRAWGGPAPGGLFLMRRIKDAFDPQGILEPGRSIVA